MTWKLKPNLIRLIPEKRLHHCAVPIVAITGGIGSGKSTVMEFLRMAKLPTICADTLVKYAYEQNEVLEFLKENCPQVITADGVNFPELRQLAFSQRHLLAQLESIIYTKLPTLFTETQKKKFPNDQVLVYEVPVLFEKNLQDQVDLIVTVLAPEHLQKKRIQVRDESSTEVIQSILDKQEDLQTKAKRSHVVIPNDQDLHALKIQVEKFIAQTFTE